MSLSESLSASGNRNVSGKQVNLRSRRNSTSSVYATETLEHPYIHKTLYYIACILQVDLFEIASAGIDLSDVAHNELNLITNLPAHLGGPISPHEIHHTVIFHETANDPILRMCIEAGTVPTVDTIFRFIMYYFNSTAVSPQCNILAFLYIKRLKSVCIFTTHNWRGLWVGCSIIAQKLYDDFSLSTSCIAGLLPGVTKLQLQALEFKVFQLLNFNAYISHSAYIQAHLNLRLLFRAVLYENQQCADRRPLRARSPLLNAHASSTEISQSNRSKSVDNTTSGGGGALFVLT